MKSSLMRITFIFFAALLLSMSYPSYSIAEKRVALLIGNSNYDVGRLENPVNDATDMAAALKKLGFSVIIKNDAGHKEMETAIKEFGRKLEKDTVGLFFYAGHGVQIDGKNYLIPLGANIEEEGDVKYKAVNIKRVFDAMDSAGNKLNIVILDACRDNPYAKGFRSSNRGLAIVGSSPNDTLIAYSTSPGQVASDGSGRNSPYTKALLDNINRPGLAIEQVFKKVRNDIDNTSSGRQKPWYLASLSTDFCFNPGGNQLPPEEQTPRLATENLIENKKPEAEQRRFTLAIIPVTLKDECENDKTRCLSENIVNQIYPSFANKITNANVYIVPKAKADTLKSQFSIKDYNQFVIAPDKPSIGNVDLEGIKTLETFAQIGFISLPEPDMLKLMQLYKALKVDSILLITIYNNIVPTFRHHIEVYYCFYTKQDKSKPVFRQSTTLYDPEDILPYINRLASKLKTYASTQD